MNIAKVKEMNAEITALLEEKYPEMSVCISGRYDQTSVKFTVEFKEEQADFNKLCGMYGLKEDDYGKTFKNGTKTYKIVGFSPSRRAYPISCKDVSTGQLTNFRREAIARLDGAVVLTN